MPRHAPLAERFWSKVDRRGADECWPWNGRRNHKHYGRISEWRDGKKAHRAATQVAWELHHGQPFPAGKIACHSCDNPPCVNPAHIWPGTDLENSTDKILKGRSNGRPCPHDRTPENLIVRRAGRRWRVECRLCINERYNSAIRQVLKWLPKLTAEERREVLTKIDEIEKGVQPC